MGKAEEAAYQYTNERGTIGYDYNQIYDAVKFGYYQAEKDTTQKALNWLETHMKSYTGPIEESFWTMFIEHFKKAMEKE